MKHTIFLHPLRCSLAATLLCLGAAALNAQTLSYKVEGTASTSGGKYAPYWFTSNRYGLGSADNQSAYLRAGVRDDVALPDSNWHFSAALDLVGGHNLSSSVLVQQAYGEAQWRLLRLTLGQKERPGELKNQRLSTGSLVESGNARPVPQVRLEVPEFWDLFHTGGWFTLRGHLAYGMFTDYHWQKDFAAAGTRYAKNILYHSKALFLKGGNEHKFPLTLVWGLQMDAQFGGTIYNYTNVAGRTVKEPERFQDFWKAFRPSHGDSETTGSDQLNIEGNQLGSWHLELAWTEPAFKVRGYLEHMFEDHSGVDFKYGLWRDGLYGIETTLTRCPWLNDIVVEYFNSSDQAGPIYHDRTAQIDDQISSQDSYYSHGEYPDWQTYGHVLGNPLISSPLYNQNGHLTIYSNRVEAFHLGLSGQPLPYLDYRLLLTKMHSWGTFAQPFTHLKGDTSGLLELTFRPSRWKGWSASASAAWNKGELYGDCGGVMLSVCKTGIFKW